MLEKISFGHKIKSALMLGKDLEFLLAETKSVFPLVNIETSEVCPETSFFAGRKYDLIVISCRSDIEGSVLGDMLAKDGHILFEACGKNTDILRHFSYRDTFKDGAREFFHLRPFGLGKVGDPAPQGFRTKEQSRFFLSLPFPFSRGVIGKDGCLGTRYVFFGIALDVYKNSDQEPFLEPYAGPRLILWYPLSETGRKKGWLRNLFIRSEWQYGHVRLAENYWENWSKHALRHRKRWKNASQFELRRATVAEFEKAYHASGKLDPMLRRGFMQVVRFHERNHPADIEAMLVFEKSSGSAIAGFVAIDYPEVSQSRHTVSFLRQEAQRTSAGYGLIDAWHERSLAKGIEWLDFGVVWRPGNDSSWKNYSDFKRQFGLYLVHFPRHYFRFSILR